MDVFSTFENVASICAGLAGIGGVLLVVYKYGYKFIRAWFAVDAFYLEFGDDPIRTLSTIIQAIEASHGELEIRQRITERHLAVGVYVCSKDGRCTWVNDWLSDAFGMDAAEMIGWGWSAAISNGDRARVQKTWQDAIDNTMPYKEEYTVIPYDGRQNQWEAITEAWPVRKRGEIVCYVGYVTHKTDK